MVGHITENTNFKHAIKQSPVVVVDFYAKWCQPCKTIAPVIEGWERKMKGKSEGRLVTFLKCDVDKMPRLSGKLGVTCMPTFLIYQNGHLYKKVEGADVSALRRAMERAMQTVSKK